MLKKILARLITSALISLLLVLPWVIMELINRRDFHEDFPTGLFILLWLLPLAFILILAPVVRTIRAGKSILAKPVELFLRVAFLALIAYAWTGTLIDQMPCFLGVPLCD